MKQSDRNSNPARSVIARTGSAVGLLLALALLFAASASASYEQVGTFGELVDAHAQFDQTMGMAVNVTGVGGVSPGTIYVARQSFEVKGTEKHYGFPTYGAKGEFLGEWPNSTDIFFSPQGVAIDQTTGNVYVLTDPGENKKGVVQVYSADGSQLIASFGERGAFKESIDEGPEKIHALSESGIAVDDSGVVYISDLENPGEFKSRVMVFEPQSPGDYEHYVYTGHSNDIAFSDPGDAVRYEPQALALDSAGNLYAVGRGEAIYEFAPGEPVAPICEYQVPAGGTEGMTVNPQSGEVFYFTYKTANKIHQLSACNQGEFEETSPFTVTPKATQIKGLAFNPTLAYEASRPPGILYAADLGPSTENTAHGDIFAPSEVRFPVVESESVSSVTSSTATLGAQINPKGSETRYAFQYITQAAYEANEPGERFAGASEAPLGGAVLGSGQSPLSAGVSLVGLDPDTEYHYRAIASSHCDPEKEEELCEDTGADQAFRTFPAEAPELPDNRAWELVSPAQKNGGEVFPADRLIASCGFECKPGQNLDGFPMQSAPGGDAVVYEGFPFSFTEGAVRANGYLSRRTESGWQTTILSPLLHSGNGGYKAFNAELTEGVLSQDNPTLSPEAPSEYANLYTQPTGALSTLTPLVKAEPPNRSPAEGLRLTFAGASADLSQLFFEANDALTGETPFAPEAVDGGAEENNLYESVGGQLQLVNVLPGNAETAPGAEFGSGELFRKGNTRKADFSHAISDDGSRVFWSSEGGAGQVYVRENGESTTAIPDPGKFLTAAADGSKVLLDNGHLYDLGKEATIDLSEGQGGFKGIVGQSEDLSRIYFVDTAALTGEEENDHGAKAQGGQNNLYAWHDGDISFVATLSPGSGETGYLRGDWEPIPAARTAEASPDGRWVAFLSKAPLTGYDSTGPCFFDGHKLVSGPCQEAFLYDSASGKLTCPSCNPTGERPLGEATLRLIHLPASSMPQPRYLTDEGRLYFDTQDSLTPFDTNNGVEDVYQYEPEGVGNCEREGGCVSLISAGHEPVDSNFLAADPEGKSVFFTSRDQLVLKDRDDLIDLYVAREDGGIPAESETKEIECQGEACLPAVIPPNDPTPGSSSFEGAGNVVEKKAAKKHKKKHKHAKKRHKRGRAAKHNRGGSR
jgi:WD40-like Beta Propeller Repeat